MLKNANRVKGSVQDIARLAALPDDDCNLLLVSSRTLYLMANYSDAELLYTSRYGKSFPGGGLYEPVTKSDAEYATVQEVIRNFQLEIIPVTCDLTAVLTQLADAITSLASVGVGCQTCPEAVTGTISDPGTSGGSPGSSPPLGYDSGSVVADDKCLVANWYYQQLLLTIQGFVDYSVLSWLALGVGVAIGLILSVLEIVVSAVFLTFAFAQFGVFTELIEAMLTFTDADLQEIIDALEADQSGFVCQLYLADEVGNARELVDEWAQAAGLSGLQATLITTILNNYLLNGLFFPNDDLLAEAALVPDPYDCSQCIFPGACPFSFGYGSGSFRYDGQEFTVSSGPGLGLHLMTMTKDCTCAEAGTPNNWCVVITDYTIDDTTTIYNRVLRGYNASCTPVSIGYNTASPSMPPKNVPLCCSALEFTDDSPFTVTLKVIGAAGPLDPGENPASNNNCV